jgi:hypothetical protein
LAFAVSLCALVPAVAGEPLSETEGRAEYRPIQSISYAFGTKFMSGYFVQKSANCLATLMIAEKSDAEHVAPQTPTRIRLVLKPGQVAGLDSEEGRSLNVTCGEAAATLEVEFGERSTLVAAQVLALPQAVAKVP